MLVIKKIKQIDKTKLDFQKFKLHVFLYIRFLDIYQSANQFTANSNVKIAPFLHIANFLSGC